MTAKALNGSGTTGRWDIISVSLSHVNLTVCVNVNIGCLEERSTKNNVICSGIVRGRFAWITSILRPREVIWNGNFIVPLDRV